MPAPTGPVQQKVGSATVAATTNTQSLAANPTAGNDIVLLVVADNNSIATPVITGLGATWSLVGGPIKPGTSGLFGISQPTMWLFVGRDCSGATASITVTFGTAVKSTLNATEWAGIDPNGAAASFAIQSSAPPAPGTLTVSITPSFSNVLCVAIATARGLTSGNPDVTAISHTGGWTAMTPLTANTYHVAAAYTSLTDVEDVAQSTTFSASHTSGEQWAYIVVALRGAPGPAQYGSGHNLAVFGGRANGTSVKIGPMPLTCRIYSPDYPIDGLLAVMNGARGLTFHDPYNDTGAGSFALPLADPKATAENLAPGNLVRCFIGPFDVFQWGRASPAYALASPAGASGEAVTIQGRSLEAYLDRAVLYAPLTWSGGSVGGLLRQTLATMQTRGAVPLVGADFSDTVDSGGTAWKNAGGLTFQRGATLLDIVKALRQQGYVIELRGDFVLRAWGSAPGAHRETSVVFREGKHLASNVQWTQPQRRVVSHLVVEGASAISVEVIDPAYVAGAPRVEGFLSATTVTTTAGLQDAGLADIAQRKLDGSAISVAVLHGSDPGELEPYRHYTRGDFVGANVPSYLDNATELIAAITIEATDAGNYEVKLDWNGRQPDPLIVLKERLDGILRTL